MLVLTVDTHGKVMVGPDIVITLISVAKGSARIGIEAPPSVEIWREKLWREMHGDDSETD